LTAIFISLLSLSAGYWVFIRNEKELLKRL
jgi:hypothetical protein